MNGLNSTALFNRVSIEAETIQISSFTGLEARNDKVQSMQVTG
jgi:hypothetical protein